MAAIVISLSEIPMTSSEADRCATGLRQQRDALQELILDVENNFMSGGMVRERILRIESNLRKLRSLI